MATMTDLFVCLEAKLSVAAGLCARQTPSALLASKITVVAVCDPWMTDNHSEFECLARTSSSSPVVLATHPLRTSVPFIPMATALRPSRLSVRTR